jgi:fatty acid desaturase
VEDVVPLSEEELRLLEQMERALAAEDPKFVSTIQGRTLERTAKLRALGAAVVFVGGMALLLGGAVAQMTWLSVVGFVVMLAAATIGLTAWRGRHAPREVAPTESFDFSDGRSFEVLNGGRAPKPRRQRRNKAARRPARAPKPSGTFMQRLEQRWQHRRDQGL